MIIIIIIIIMIIIITTKCYMGERRRVLHRRYCIAQPHRASYICTLCVDVIVLNFNESVMFVCCVCPPQDQIDLRYIIYFCDSVTIDFRMGLALLTKGLNNASFSGARLSCLLHVFINY